MTYVFGFYRQMGRLCQQYGKLFIFHSDGKIVEVWFEGSILDLYRQLGAYPPLGEGEG